MSEPAIGTEFEQLTTVSKPYKSRSLYPSQRKKGTTLTVVDVQCTCGKKKTYPLWALNKGKFKSCGCRARAFHDGMCQRWKSKT